MSIPLTLPDAEARGLLAASGEGVHTFSNGTAWDCWAEPNCYDCWHWAEDCAGERCAFEAASLLGAVSPDLARLFGWVQDPQWDTPTDHRHGWDAPEQCPFFRARRRDDGEDSPPPPPPDPRQLVLFADPTEDAAVFSQAPVVSLPALAEVR